MLKVLSRIPKYKAFRVLGYPRILPMSLTLSLLYRCNSRCATCDVYKKPSQDLTLEEWTRIFKSIGKNLYWVTMSGGEPFLRKEIADIAANLYQYCEPNIINIPTNGLLCDTIERNVKKILESCPGVNLVINLSLDGVGEHHDRIRGVKGNFERLMKTYRLLKAIKHPNLTVGLHTVISKFNVDRMPEIVEFVRNVGPDSYITEIAENRVELGSTELDITPTREQYGRAVASLLHNFSVKDMKGVAKVAQAFRHQYYQLTMRWLEERRQIIPCYAGFASAQIAPDGDIWMCCVEAIPIGNLRENDYDFGRVWRSERAEQVRQRIRKGLCECPLANVSYVNMLHNVRSLIKVGKNYFGLEEPVKIGVKERPRLLKHEV